MKTLLLIVSIIGSFQLLLFAQNAPDGKRDYNWMFGYENYPPDWGGTRLNFNQIPPTTSNNTLALFLCFTDASISDTNGNMLFYTNGMYVANANHQLMPNGDSLNPGDLFNYYQGYGYRLIQGALIIPLPGSDSLYLIIHEKLVWSNQYFTLATDLSYSLVDMSLDNGLGDVIQKNVIVNSDTFDMGLITATRHANGRDWWILIPEFLHNRYYRYLVCPQGIILDGVQTIGIASYKNELGQACFSPDGTKYVRYGAPNFNVPFRLDVFDFDRCTGLLSNYRNLWYVDNAGALGIAISPNSRFMYTSAQTRVDQYDLWAADIAASRVTVALYDGFIDPLFSLGKTYFFMAQLAPDNKIYICTSNGTHYLHVINQPDLPGLLCNVTQHSQYLNTFNASSLPNFPNYRLGALPCSECDTLGLSGAVIQGKVEYNNIAGTPLDSCFILLHDTDGTVLDSTWSDVNGDYRFCGLATGNYYLTITTDKPWGGGNAIDALLSMQYFTGLITLAGLSLVAADVNLSNNINAIDALLIQKRFVGLSASFEAGDWIFEQPQISISGNTNLTINIKGVCVGDLNNSNF